MSDVPKRDARAVHTEAFELGNQRRRGAWLALDIDVAGPAVLVDTDGKRADAKLLLQRAIRLKGTGEIPATQLVPAYDIGQTTVGLDLHKNGYRTLLLGKGKMALVLPMLHPFEDLRVGDLFRRAT
jgi:hypothetical protein